MNQRQGAEAEDMSGPFFESNLTIPLTSEPIARRTTLDVGGIEARRRLNE